MKMARSSISSQCDSIASYMDGVHVKIAEAYKPPRKVGLPAAYNNKLPDVSRLTYDFSLENSVLEKMVEWRKVREANNELRQARLEEKRKREEKENSLTKTAPSLDNKQSLKIVPPETTILTPQPLSPPANDSQSHVKANGLDFADFDNDTSSPFDNMELKTINDMEELAQVLQPTSQWAPTTKLENILNELTIEDSQEQENKDKDQSINSEMDNQQEGDKCINTKYRSVSAIIQELQKELDQPTVKNWKPWPDLESLMKQENSEKPVESQLANPLADLSTEDQELAQHLNDMGFPISRAARAIRDLGGEDNKKIVEYLLTVQSLEEHGIRVDEAERALILTNYDVNKARIYHENLNILRTLGFPEDTASKALLKCDIDRDKAVDYLLGK